MHTSGTIILYVLCIAALVIGGCTQPAMPPPGSGPAVTENSATGGAQVIPCSIGLSADPSKSGILEITSAHGEVVTKNVIMISGKIKNKGGGGTSSGVAAKLCNTRTGNCVDDMVGVILKPHETVEYSLIPLGGCPDTASETSSCQCEVWIDILR